jgi:hypothetical protein
LITIKAACPGPSCVTPHKLCDNMHAILLLLEHRKLCDSMASNRRTGPAGSYLQCMIRRTSGPSAPAPERNGSDPSTALQGHPWLAGAGASVAATKIDRRPASPPQPHRCGRRRNAACAYPLPDRVAKLVRDDTIFPAYTAPALLHRRGHPEDVWSTCKRRTNQPQPDRMLDG